jgi:hypothetical protein
MQVRNASPLKYLCSGLILVAAGMVLAPAVHAQSNNSNKSQMVYLPDPTPRPPDPHLLLHDNPQTGTSTQDAVEHRNEKRRELVVWAANELVALSERLETDVAEPKTGASTATAAADAEKIEQLAKNLTAALKAP